MGDNSSVKVAVRLRPLVKSEIEKGCKNILEVYKDASQIRVKDTEKAFTFNYVLDTDSSQVDLYNSCVKDIIPNLFKGKFNNVESSMNNECLKKIVSTCFMISFKLGLK